MTDHLVIHWRKKNTGQTGHGSPLPSEEALKTCAFMVREDTSCIYWTEPPKQGADE